MEIVKSLEESGLLIKEISETIKNETKKQKRELFSVLWGTLAGSIFSNALAVQRVTRAGKITIGAGEKF